MRSVVVVSLLLVSVALLGWMLFAGGEPEAAPGSANSSGSVTATEPRVEGSEEAARAEGAEVGDPQRAEVAGSMEVPGAPAVSGPTRPWRGRLLLGDAATDPVPLAGLPLRLLHRADVLTPIVEVATLRTAADGGFEVDAPLAAGFVALVVADSERRVPVATVVHEERQSDRNAPKTGLLDISDRVVVGPGSLKLEVVDEATGRPVGGGASVAVKVDVPVSVRAVRLFGLLRDGYVLAETDAGGFATVEGLPRGRAEFMVHDGVHQPRWGLAEITASGVQVEQRVTLRAGHSLRGRVLDADGQPVVGAEVTLRSYGAEHHAFSGDGSLLTDVDGAFAWRDLGSGDTKLMVSSAQHPSLELSLPTGAEVHEIRLRRGHPVTVRLRGELGRVVPTDVRLEFEVVDEDLGASLFDRGRYALEFGRFTFDADAAFHFPKAVAGSYRVRALLGEAGNTEWVDFEVVEGEHDGVQVELVFDPGARRELVVQVVDEQGGAVEGAEVLWLCGRTYAPTAEGPDAVQGLRSGIEREAGNKPGGVLLADAEGRVRVHPAADQRLELVATAPGCWPATFRVDADESAAMPEHVELVLRRAGAVEVQAWRGADEPDIHRSIVVLDPEGQEVAQKECDGSGNYRIEPLLPGSYDLVPTLWVWNRYEHDAAVQPDSVVAVLGARRFEARKTRIEVRAGETTAAALEFPAEGAVVGRVLRGGVPFAGAEVFAVALDADGRRIEDQLLGGRFSVHDDEPPIGVPVSLSDRSGRYRFRILGPGSFDLWVRHRDGFVSSGPVRIEARPGVEQVVDLALGDASIAGRIDAAWLGTWDERGRRAYVFRDDDVADDAFASGMHQLPRSSSLVDVKLGDDGAFRFDHLPAGRYLLRFAARLNPVPGQVAVVVGAGQDVDLGALALRTHTVQLRAELPADVQQSLPEGARLRGVVRQVFDGFAQPAFVGVIGLPESAELQLAPGRYEVELERVVVHGYAHTEITSERRFARFVVDGEGGVEPALLVFEQR